MAAKLLWYAGKTARERILRDGLHPEMIRWIIGAAGGPKWLLLSALDQAIFGEWLRNVGQPVHLLGGSIASWRFAAACCPDPAAATRRLQHGYIHQYYDKKPSRAEISQKSRTIFSDALDNHHEELLHHPFLRLNILVARSRHLLATDARVLLYPLLGLAALANALHRRTLSAFFQRFIFHHPEYSPPVDFGDKLPEQRLPLSTDNLITALLASGSIPLVLEGVRNIPGAPDGTYHDGGITDYHIDGRFNSADGIVLYPHFMPRIIPGWFDKALPWRKPRAANLDNLLLLAPSQDFVNTLPNRKITDRNDFYLYTQDERIAIWENVATAGAELAAEFLSAVEQQSVTEKLLPIEALGR